MFLLSFASIVPAADKKGGRDDGYVKIDAAELQLQVMAFADRYYANLVSAFDAYEKQSPPGDDLKRMMEICTYSISSAFTRAAEPNPVSALFDMVVMVTLGHIVFKNNLLPEHGQQLQPLVDGFLKAKNDIWEVSSKILTPEQQQTLKTLIAEWRKNNPSTVFFPVVRFGNFTGYRAKEAEKKSRGLFSSVENATEQVEEAVLLGERSMFLGTRMPQLIGLFGGVWFTQFAKHPDMKQMLQNINQLSKLPEHLKGLLPELRVALESVEKRGQEWLVFGFLLGIALILVFLVGAVLALLAYRYYALRLFGSTHGRPVTTNAQ